MNKKNNNIAKIFPAQWVKFKKFLALLSQQTTICPIIIRARYTWAKHESQVLMLREEHGVRGSSAEREH